jgi:tetratricopeptide (TPR) repeat protein
MSACALCLTAPAPKTGCACADRRAHVECLTAEKHDGMWYMCPVCSQEYTGATRMALATEWVRRTRASGSDAERMRARSHHAYAVGCDGRYDESELELRACIEETRHKLGRAHRLTLQTTGHLAEVLLCADRLVDAEAVARQLVEAAVCDEEYLGSAECILARIVGQIGQLDEAEALFRKSKLPQLNARPLALVLIRQGRYAEAYDQARLSFEFSRATFGDAHEDTRLDLSMLLHIAARMKGRRAHRCASCGSAARSKRCAGCKAVWYCDERCQGLHRLEHRPECLRVKLALLTERRAVEPVPSDGLDGLDGLDGRIVDLMLSSPLAMYSEAERLVQEQLDAADSHWAVIRASAALAAAIALQGRPDDARQTIQSIAESRWTTHPESSDAARRVSKYAAVVAKMEPDKVVALSLIQAELELDIHHNIRNMRTWLALGRALGAQGRVAEAASALERALEIATVDIGPHRRTDRVRSELRELVASDSYTSGGLGAVAIRPAVGLTGLAGLTGLTGLTGRG